MSSPWPGCLSCEESVIFTCDLQMIEQDFCQHSMWLTELPSKCALWHNTEARPLPQGNHVITYKNTHTLLPPPSDLVLFVHGREDDHGFPQLVILSHYEEPSNNLQTPQNASLASKTTQRLQYEVFRGIFTQQDSPPDTLKEKNTSDWNSTANLFNESLYLPCCFQTRTSSLEPGGYTLNHQWDPGKVYLLQFLFGQRRVYFPKKPADLEMQWWDKENLSHLFLITTLLPPYSTMSLCETVQIVLKEHIPSPSLDNSHMEPALLPCDSILQLHRLCSFTNQSWFSKQKHK